MPQMKVDKDFYTAAQVKEKLGITQLDFVQFSVSNRQPARA